MSNRTVERALVSNALVGAAAADADVRKEYRTLGLRASAMLRQMGLVQTLTFLASREADSGAARRYRGDFAKVAGFSGNDSANQHLTAALQSGSLLAQTELLERSLAAAEQLHRFVQIHIPGDARS